MTRPMGATPPCNLLSFLEDVREFRGYVCSQFSRRFFHSPFSAINTMLFRLPGHTMIPLKRKAAFLSQQTYRLNARSSRVQVRPVRSQEQQSKRRRQDAEWHSHHRMHERVTLESLRAPSAEAVVTLTRQRY